ncbi:ScyD/ScyE family protein [Thermomonospora amylolytica]|uniref:ScyD/ScyE family protein n=1 Tax=Thermomonospora amylolytica TaxID=1411117 RepID=UPI001300BA31|nr:ScyD/ScyE family protein [Thermomonospora amylolytica]
MSRSRKSSAVVCLAAAGGLVAALLPGQPGHAHAAQRSEVIAQGLNGPRGITVLDDGTILVAESGTGGSGPCYIRQGKRSCFGNTGSIYRVRGHQKGRVLHGLPSVGDSAGREASGPVDVAVSGDGYLVLNGGGPGIRQRAALGPAARRIGTLYQVGRDPHDRGRVIADMLAHEERHDPDRVTRRAEPGESTVHANPWRFAPAGQGGWLVTDAGANDLIRVGEHGRTFTEAIFPPNAVPPTESLVTTTSTAAEPSQRLAESVPTGIVQGRDGAYYVAEFGGLKPRTARVWRIVPGRRPQAVASGLTALADIAVDRRGDLIVLSMTEDYRPDGTSAPGALHRIDLRTGTRTPIAADVRLTMPTGLAVGRRGELYVSNNGVGNGAGQLLRIRP